MTLLTVKEYADLIRVDPMTVYRRVWRDRQPGAIRIGRDIRIDVSEALASLPKPLNEAPGLLGLYRSV